MPPAIVDAHAHVWKHDPAFPWATPRPPAADATPEMLLALMEKHGVARTVLVQVIHYRWDNRFVAAAVRAYPRHFAAVARVNPEDPAAPEHLARLVEVDGFRGVRLSPAADASGDWIRGPLMPPLFARCQALRVPMTILTTPGRLADVGALAARFPELTIVIDHMADTPVGDPAALAPLLGLARYARVLVKISHAPWLSAEPYPHRDTHTQIQRLHAAFGASRLLWATDWPLVEDHGGYANALGLVEELAFLSEDDRRAILGGNATRIWG
jgi:L-fuconolactonase